ncbi:DinB family protein [bacterium SCSIO 12741]|nr:DinB family protein [bacterium SCSIO 12741]
MMTVAKPKEGTYNPYFTRYIDLVDENDLMTALENNRVETLNFFSQISDEQGLHRYAEGKWSIKELFQHLIDTERIFANRALRFARKDSISLPGYDHDAFVPESRADRRSMAEMCTEFDLVRQGTLAMYRSFDDDMMAGTGNANGADLTVVAIGYLTAGHGKHHQRIIRERYLTA